MSFWNQLTSFDVLFDRPSDEVTSSICRHHMQMRDRPFILLFTSTPVRRKPFNISPHILPSSATPHPILASGLPPHGIPDDRETARRLSFVDERTYRRGIKVVPEEMKDVVVVEKHRRIGMGTELAMVWGESGGLRDGRR
jgi:hypothetical protein